jgi:hypothetical protein
VTTYSIIQELVISTYHAMSKFAAAEWVRFCAALVSGSAIASDLTASHSPRIIKNLEVFGTSSQEVFGSVAGAVQKEITPGWMVVQQFFLDKVNYAYAGFELASAFVSHRLLMVWLWVSNALNAILVTTQKSMVSALASSPTGLGAQLVDPVAYISSKLIDLLMWTPFTAPAAAVFTVTKVCALLRPVMPADGYQQMASQMGQPRHHPDHIFHPVHLPAQLPCTVITHLVKRAPPFDKKNPTTCTWHHQR